MADVFISYAREDATSARRVAKALQSAGLDVWWDADLPVHRAYSEEIERNLEAAHSVVVLWSRGAAASQWVRAEADFARNANKLVQGQLDGTLPPMPFNQIQCADLKGWKGSLAHPGWAKLKHSVEVLVSGGEVPTSPAHPGTWNRIQSSRWWIVAALALAVGAGLLAFALIRPVEERRPVLAVLPFTSLDSRDESLASGMWEDTRNAIGRNPQLTVLGPNTAEELAKKGPNAIKRVAAYSIEANIRSTGDRIRVNANLVRTADGAQLWSENFDRHLDDVFALQSEIASEIEGRIRGRLAERGGRTPEHIATSGDVYALYSDARAKIRKRDIYGGYEPAITELNQVVRIDPNFAPAWASLAVAEQLAPFTGNGLSSINIMNASEGHARRAIALAPNLAAGHAALAFSLGLDGPVANAEIRRAVELDPNDPEALNWLGFMQRNQNRSRDALVTWRRVVEIEPLWWPAVFNLVDLNLEMGNDRGAAAELERVRRLGSRQLETAVAIEIANFHNDLSRAAQMGLAYLRNAPTGERGIVTQTLWSVLLQLGYDDLAWKISPAPPFAALLRKDDPRALQMVESLHLTPAQFFSTAPLQNNVARAMLVNGRGADLVVKYKALKFSAEELEHLVGREDFLILAPLLGKALQQAGANNDAASILSKAEASASFAMPNPGPSEAGALARIYAVQGRGDAATTMLATAVNRGWLPRAPQLQNDIADDPAFASLRSDPRFNQLRGQILGTIRRERAELGNVSYPAMAPAAPPSAT